MGTFQSLVVIKAASRSESLLSSANQESLFEPGGGGEPRLSTHRSPLQGSGPGDVEGRHSVTPVPLRALTPHFSSGIRAGSRIWWPHGTIFLLWPTEFSYSTEALHGTAECGSHPGLWDSLLAICLHHMLSLAPAEGHSPSTLLSL